MPQRPFRITDIAAQSGLSAATVDRVLHRRPGASARAIRAVDQALLDLEKQQTQLRLGQKSVVLDLVMHAPARFSRAVKEALEAELPTLRPAVVRARFHLAEQATTADLVAVLDSVGDRGRSSQGVLLKAPDHPDIAAAVDRLAARGIPVVTLVTDVHRCARVAYAGLDNASAGSLAAYLGSRFAAARPGPALVTLSRGSFFGEQERLDGFRTTLAEEDPAREVLVLSGADGLDPPTGALVADLLARRADIALVYSPGGGNTATVEALTQARVVPAAYIAHDLDADNVRLLLGGALTTVLHHDLRADLGHACRQVLRHHGLLPGAPTSRPAPAQVVTRHNLPIRLS